MIPLIENHIWQSTLFAAAAWLLTVALRGNRARVRHAVWLVGLLKFLVPFAALVSLGTHLGWRTAPERTPANITIMMDQLSEPFRAAAVTASGAAPDHADRTRMRPAVWADLVLAIWALGLAGISASWLVRWRRIRTVVRAGSEIDLQIPIRVTVSPTMLEPGVFGIWRPVLMLPDGIFEKLSPSQWNAVVEHELCHVRHRDNFFAAIQMLVETVFWFHPMVWWIGRRMIAERERACDEAVLGSGSEPRTYAEAILNICKSYVQTQLVCVAGVTGAELKDRIQAILSGNTGTELGVWKRAALSVAAAAAILGPVAIGVMDAPRMRAQSPAAQSPTTQRAVPKWEAASIKPCDDQSGGRKGGGGPTPGRLNVGCSTVMSLIEQAYGFYGNGRSVNWNHIAYEGAPAWVNSEAYSIEAKAESPQRHTVMHGPMLQALLEERFKLKIRREIREVPVYNLTVAKGGPKNLTPTKEGSCIPLDFDHLPRPEPGKPMPEICGMFGRKRIAEGEREVVDPGVTMAEFAGDISALLDRNVIDKTGISGTFDINVRISLPDPLPRDPSAPRTPEDETDLILATVQKLGMKLESARGPGEAFVIEHVERPSNDFEPPAVAKPAAAKR